jgi:cation:H+ antiporter
MVDVNAVRMGLTNLAVGDLMGSSLFNLLILAVLDLSFRSRGQMFSRAAGAHALSATMSISLTALAAGGILLGQALAPFTVWGVSLSSWAILGAYVLGLRLVFYDQLLAARQQLGPSPEVLVPAGRLSLPWAVLGYLGSAAVIVVAAPFLAEAAGELADLTGLGGTFVGTTLVALCTSLPELVASLTAIRMGAFDLALGNVFGSNAFNMVLLVPLDAVHAGPLMAAVSPTHAVTCLATILITSIAIMGQLYHAERRIRFIEPDALLIIILVLGALGLVYYLG